MPCVQLNFTFFSISSLFVNDCLPIFSLEVSGNVPTPGFLSLMYLFLMSLPEMHGPLLPRLVNVIAIFALQ